MNMVKANPIVEFFKLEDRFYPDMDIVYVKKADSNKVEKHYYRVSSDGKILVFEGNTRDAIINPLIRGRGISIDAKSKRSLYKWRWGAPFATQLFSNEPMEKLVFTEQDAHALFDLGVEWQLLNTNPNAVKADKTNWMQYILIAGALVFAYLWYTGQLDLSGLIGGAFPKGS